MKVDATPSLMQIIGQLNGDVTDMEAGIKKLGQAIKARNTDIKYLGDKVVELEAEVRDLKRELEIDGLKEITELKEMVNKVKSPTEELNDIFREANKMLGVK